MYYEKNVKGKECTILWHDDNLNMLRVDSGIISSVIAEIDSEYGNIAKITITRDKIHKYLGMTTNYFSPIKVIFSIVDYIGKVIYNIL